MEENDKPLSTDSLGIKVASEDRTVQEETNGNVEPAKDGQLEPGIRKELVYVVISGFMSTKSKAWEINSAAAFCGRPH